MSDKEILAKLKEIMMNIYTHYSDDILFERMDSVSDSDIFDKIKNVLIFLENIHKEHPRFKDIQSKILLEFYDILMLIIELNKKKPCDEEILRLFKKCI